MPLQKSPPAAAAEAPSTPVDSSDTKKTAASSSEKENGRQRQRSSKTYVQYVHEAIVALKDRTGSSQPAISKWVLAKYPQLECAHFKSRLNQALKSGVKSQRFTKIKASYKISSEYKAKERAKKRHKAKAAATQSKNVSLETTQKQNKAKLAQLEQTLSPQALEKAKAKMKKAEEAARQREEAARQAKERADRLRRRRFPMEDLRLHQEDVELNVKPPPDVKPRPHLPYFWNCTLPYDHPTRAGGKTSSMILEKSKCDELDFDSRGLVADLLQVYHFFTGDVQYLGDDEDAPVVPNFTLSQLIFAVEQLVNGTVKRTRMVPPLLVHLFCISLQMVCQTRDEGSSSSLAHLQRELSQHLPPALSPTSWSDVLFLYMDAMERYMATDASRDPTVVLPLHTDIKYLLGVKDQPQPMTPAVLTRNRSTDENEPDDNMALPEGYHAYLGDTRGVLYKAHAKLARHDPWLLTAEEVMALLRALTDDVLSLHPGISENIAARDFEMQQLKRDKRAADAKFRKVRLAYEGPKQKSTTAGATAGPKKPSSEEEKKDDDDNGVKSKAIGGDAENQDGNETKPEAPFKPTATKKQFEAARKAQQKASDAYEKGIRKLVARTEPIGYDRNHNAVYCFRHDPEVLYVEDLRPASAVAAHLPSDMQLARRSWHVIETTSLFDNFVASLDIRGRREHDLYEELLGPQGAQQSLRRYLYDDVKEEAAVKARLKEMEDLKEKMENARNKCDEESRRSGRLAGKATEELDEIQNEIDALEKKMRGDSVPETRDYEELTGLKLLRKFDSGGVRTRRTREKLEASKASNITLMPCSKLLATGNIDGTGLVGMLVSEMLELEEQCNSLTPWERSDVMRSQWISRVEGSVYAWDSISPTPLGSPEASRVGNTGDELMNVSETPKSSRRDSLGSMGSASERSKRRRLETPMPNTSISSIHSVSQIITLLKQPLLDLETRVADITNVAAATRDANLADDNMSTDESDEDKANKERLEIAWKRIVHKIRNTPTKRHVQIRDMVVEAISAARKAHLSEVVSQLRSALLQYHPSAAGQCKADAVAVLVAHGDYDPSEDDCDEDEDDEEENEDEEEEMPSLVSAEAAILISSLDGSEDASRLDWIDAVKNCKTISRLASLTTAFLRQGKEQLEKLQGERDALVKAVVTWEKEEERRVKNRAGKKGNGRPPKETVGPSEVWANVQITDEICMAKAEDYPYWPAKKCRLKDPELAQSLATLQRSLVSLVGEMGGLRVVKDENIQPFTGKKIEDDDELAEFPKGVRSQLDDCMTMARRILRGLKSASDIPSKATTK